MLFYMDIKTHEKVVQNYNRITWETEAWLWHKWDRLKQNKINA